MEKEESEAYYAWREYEAWQVPMTQYGEELARQRWAGFKAGYLAALHKDKEKADE